MTEEELKLAFFKKISGYSMQMVVDFNEELNGLRSYSYNLHTQEANETTLFNNWNFTTAKIWDSVEEGFWFQPKTTILYNTDTYVIGKE